MKWQPETCHFGTKNIQMVIWNVHCLGTKTNDIRDYLKQFEIVAVTETWIEKKDTSKVEKPNGRLRLDVD